MKLLEVKDPNVRRRALKQAIMKLSSVFHAPFKLISDNGMAYKAEQAPTNPLWSDQLPYIVHVSSLGGTHGSPGDVKLELHLGERQVAAGDQLLGELQALLRATGWHINAGLLIKGYKAYNKRWRHQIIFMRVPE